MTAPRCAIILAAGTSRRLMPLTRDCPKCLLAVGDRTILERQIEALLEVGVEDLAIVTGHGAAHVRAACAGQARFVHNPVYATTNSLYSLSLAGEAVAGRPFLLLNSDVVVDPRLVVRLVQSPAPNALLVDFDARLDDEAMKVSVQDGLVVAIDKRLPPADSDGENVGIVKFGAAGAAALFRAARRLVAAGRTDAWAPAAYAEMLGETEIAAVPTDGLPWIEIDFPEDLARATVEVVPRLDAARADQAPARRRALAAPRPARGGQAG